MEGITINDVPDHLVCAVVTAAEMEAEELQIPIERKVLIAMVNFAAGYLGLVGRELAMFCRHAGRKAVNMDDVLLFARRNPSLAAQMELFVERLSEKSKEEKRRKKGKESKSIEGRQKPQCDEEPIAQSLPTENMVETLSKKSKEEKGGKKRKKRKSIEGRQKPQCDEELIALSPPTECLKVDDSCTSPGREDSRYDDLIGSSPGRQNSLYDELFGSPPGRQISTFHDLDFSSPSG